MKTTTKLRKGFEKDIERTETIDELVWIDCDIKEASKSLSWEDFYSLETKVRARRAAFETKGQKYRRARKPAWR